MKKRAIAVLSVGALALTAAASTSYVIGKHIQQEFTQIANDWSSANSFNIRVLEYNRGLTHSHAVSLWSFAAETDSYDITVTHDIVHGPWFWGKAAKISSKFHLPDSTDTQLKEALRGLSPLEWQMTADWLGATQHSLSSPKFTAQFQDQSSLTWGGLQAHWNLSAERNAAQGSMRMPLMRTQVEDITPMEWEDVKLSFDVKIPQGHQFWQGPAQLEFKLLAMHEPETATEFRLHQWLIKSNLEMQDQLVNMNFQSRISTLEMQEYRARNLMLSLQMKQIHADWLDQMLQWIQLREEDELSSHAILQALPIFLSGQPEIAINQLSIDTDDGPAQLAAHINYIGTRPEAFDPANDIKAMLRASLPKAMLLQILDAKVRSDYLDLLELMEQDLDEEALQAAVEDGVGKRLKGLLSLGALQEEKSQYSAELQLEQGEFKLNGRPTELQYLLQLGEAM